MYASTIISIDRGSFLMTLHEGRTYAVTGARAGIGAATVAALKAAGARVITVDLADADVICDVGELDRLDVVADRILELAGGTLHGYVNGAGVGPTNRKPSTLLGINAFGAIELMTRLRPAFEQAENPRVTVISSNTITCHPNPISAELIRSCLARPHAEMLKRIDEEIAPDVAYAVSKTVLTRWARTSAPTADWLGKGIHLNVVAPGGTDTGMHSERATDPAYRDRVEAFPLPLGRLLQPDEVAEVVLFTLTPATGALAGSVIFCDAGVDALFHPTAPEPYVSAS
jgi:NAD(P)-dependent dehydrogenase (short-subunit alcohol dehydrogenase family)